MEIPIVSYAAERDLILEVNTYMFPPLRRDPTMVGRNDRFTPAETAHYHMERYRLQRGEEDFTRFLQNILRGIAPPPGLDEDCVDPVDGTISCRAGNASFWVTWDGWLTPCGMMPKPRIELKGKPFRETKTNSIAFRPRQGHLPGANFVVWARIRSFRSSGHQRDCRA